MSKCALSGTIVINQKSKKVSYSDVRGRGASDPNAAHNQVLQLMNWRRRDCIGAYINENGKLITTSGSINGVNAWWNTSAGRATRRPANPDLEIVQVSQEWQQRHKTWGKPGKEDHDELFAIIANFLSATGYGTHKLPHKIDALLLKLWKEVQPDDARTLPRCEADGEPGAAVNLSDGVSIAAASAGGGVAATVGALEVVALPSGGLLSLLGYTTHWGVTTAVGAGLVTVGASVVVASAAVGVVVVVNAVRSGNDVATSEVDCDENEKPSGDDECFSDSDLMTNPRLVLLELIHAD